MAHTKVGRKARASAARFRVGVRRSIASAPKRRKASPRIRTRKLASPSGTRTGVRRAKRGPLRIAGRRPGFRKRR